MTRNAKNKKDRHGAADDVMHGLRELASAIETGVPLDKRFTVRIVKQSRIGKKRVGIRSSSSR